MQGFSQKTIQRPQISMFWKNSILSMFVFISLSKAWVNHFISMWVMSLFQSASNVLLLYPCFGIPWSLIFHADSSWSRLCPQPAIPLTNHLEALFRRQPLAQGMCKNLFLNNFILKGLQQWVIYPNVFRQSFLPSTPPLPSSICASVALRWWRRSLRSLRSIFVK